MTQLSILTAPLLDAHDCENVKRWLEALRSVMPRRMYERWMRVVLTDNGEEFSDEEGIGALLGEKVEHGSFKVHLYYCDPRQSQQKGSCEKNHTEIRQILKKGAFVFDELERADLAVLMSHINSNPRESLGGKSPIQMLRFIYGQEDADALLDAFGICEMSRDELVLKPEILRATDESQKYGLSYSARTRPIHRQHAHRLLFLLCLTRHHPKNNPS